MPKLQVCDDIFELGRLNSAKEEDVQLLTSRHRHFFAQRRAMIQTTNEELGKQPLEGLPEVAGGSCGVDSGCHVQGTTSKENGPECEMLSADGDEGGCDGDFKDF